MQQLNSKNYDRVAVKIRDIDDLVMMNVSNGTKLMDYLTSNDVTSHVQITDQTGNVIVVRTTDILKVEPVMKQKDVKDYV